jgi:hypothetical protein
VGVEDSILTTLSGVKQEEPCCFIAHSMYIKEILQGASPKIEVKRLHNTFC